MKKLSTFSPCSIIHVCFVFAFLFCKQIAFGDDSVLFSHLSIEQGLSNNSVRAIYKDHNGFMWFGTYDGLNRYDGYGFKVFRNKINDTASLPHNYIYSLVEDKRNNLWVGTGQGIGIYNFQTEKFSSLYYQNAISHQREKVSAAVNAVCTDANGTVFVGLNGWGLLVKPQEATTADQVLCNRAGHVTADYNVQCMVVDSLQTIWLFVQDVGLCVYNPKERKIEPVVRELRSANSLASGGGSVWIGTSDGLFQYAIGSHSLEKIFDKKVGLLDHENIAALFFDPNDKKLWVGTEGGGISIFYTDVKRTEYIFPSEKNQGLTSESVFAIYIDGQSRKWVGTIKGGINVIDPEKRRFKTVAHDPLNPNSLVNNFASSFFEGKEGNLWIGTDGGGFSIWDRKTNRFVNYRHQPGNSASLSHDQVTSILQDEGGSTWITTFGGGINKLSPDKTTFKHYSCINAVTGEENRRAWLLYEDREKTLWATTFGRGRVYRYNRKADHFEVFDQVLNDLVSLFEDRSGRLWGGNSHQLIQINRGNGKHVIYEIGKPVRSILESRSGEFWVGTEGGGLLLFDRQQGRITARYADGDGLCNNSVLAILEDGLGRLWLSTFNGLSRFTPAQKMFKNFYAADGLQSNQFLYSAGLKLRSGEMVFGGVNGFTLFRPDSLTIPKTFAPLMLTALRINNVPVTANDPHVRSIDNDRIISLEIPYDEASLAFEYAALDFSAPEKISYAYYLEGWDKGWNLAGGSRRATYTRLKEGHYKLRIKATNTSGDWNPTEWVIQVQVFPPWYRSWWAYTLYAVLIGFLIYSYLRYKTRQTQLRYEVKLAHIETEKEKELAEKKLSFFTDVSHEFRTPLTLIINPLKDYLSKTKGESGELKVVYRNARRLLGLVDQLLLFQKAGTEGDQLKISRLNFNRLCKDVFESFSSGAKAKRLEYNFESTNEDLEVCADREKIEIVLYNLLSNALKYTPEGGRIRLRLEELDALVTVSVSDTGPGISPEAAEKLFQRFYRVANTKENAKPGFGIGLYLVRHFTELHGGKVVFSSRPGEETVFTIQLPKSAPHVDEEVLSEKETDRQTLLSELVDEDNVEEENTSLDELISDRRSILIVEDNNEIRNYVKGIFIKDFIVHEATNGAVGFQLAERYQPDVVISDIMMEGGNGVELCNNLKNNPSLNHIPVILLTGISSDEIKLKGIECGADDYITKPFQKELLVAKVENILKNRSQLQAYFFNEITLKKHDLKVSPEDAAFLKRCIGIVESHLEDDEFNIKKFTQEIGMSHSNLYRKVKLISGQSVTGFIRFIRLRRAAEFLIQTNGNVNEVAFQVGFADTKYFRKQFVALFGMNPSDYIRKYRPLFSKDLKMNEKLNNPRD